MWGHELNAAEEKLKEDVGWQSQAESRRKRLVTAQAYYTRLNNVKDERNALLIAYRWLVQCLVNI